MNISSETHLAAVVLKLDGEFTADVADQFRREVKDILQSSDSNFIIDCQCMQLIDSVGLESLLWLSDELHRNGQKLRFTNVPGGDYDLLVTSQGFTDYETQVEIIVNEEAVEEVFLERWDSFIFQ